MDIYHTLTSLYLHKLEIRFCPQGLVNTPYWVGAVWRNRFLHAAHEVITAEGDTLYDRLNTCPLVETHPYFKLLAGGFPKGFFFDCSSLPFSKGETRLEAGRLYTVTLTLIGKCARLHAYFVEALLNMCNDGLGHPVVPLSLIDITEVGGSLIFSEREGVVYPLRNPLRLDTSVEPPQGDIQLVIKLITPVSLMNPNRADSSGQGYQNKLNNFPSFYQFMRSALHRLLTLHLLYTDNDRTDTPQEMTEEIETYIQASARALLQQVELRHVSRYSTPRVGKNNVYALYGYIGFLSFSQVPACYEPLLQLCSLLGVGNDINYGLGMFRLSSRLLRSISD